MILNVKGKGDDEEIRIIKDDPDHNEIDPSQNDGTLTENKYGNRGFEEYNFSDVNVSVPSKNIHIGTRISLNGPITITNVNKSDLKSIEINCSCLSVKKESGSKIRGNMKKLENKILERWNIKKCFVLCFAITFIQVVVLLLHFIYFNETNKSCFGNIDEQKINEMNANLRKFIQRKVRVDDSNWCTYQCYVDVVSTIRLVIPMMHKTYWFDCLFKKFNCESFFHSEQIYAFNLPIPLNDIYYNYIVGMKGEIYEARSLNCPFDDAPLEKDHSSMITVGIAYCFPGNGMSNRLYALNEFTAVNELVYKLKVTGLLNESYAVQLPDICKNTFLADHTSLAHPVSFYDTGNNIYNLKSSFWNPEMIENLLFDTNVTGSNNIIRRDPLTHPLAEHNRCDDKNRTDSSIRSTVDTIIMKLTFMVDRYLIAMCGDLKLCLREIIKISQQVTNLRSHLFNYFVYLRGSVFEGVSLNCSLRSDDRTNVISILIIDPLQNRDPDMKIYFLSTLLPEIVKDVRNNINYNNVTIEITCDSDYTDIISVYELLTNNAFVTNKGLRASDLASCKKLP